MCCDNSSSSHTDSYNNNFPVLGEGSIDDSSNCVAALKRKFSINCTKPKTKFAWICIIMVVIYLLKEKWAKYLTLPGLGGPSRSAVNFHFLYPKNEKFWGTQT